jgi:hypothetical protein
VYKVVLTHQVLPGKLAEIMAWFKQEDARRTEQDPAYEPYKRYITVFGSVYQLVIELEVEDLSKEAWIYEKAYAERASGSEDDFAQMIIPGRTELRVLKELDLSS